MLKVSRSKLGFCLAFSAAVFISGIPTGRHQAHSGTTLTFYGAAQEVGGSCMVLNHQSTSVLVDCGIYYEEEFQDESAENTCDGARDLYLRNTAFSFNPSSLAAVVVTHAHTDHCGRLKYLVDRGLKAPIYMTPATRELAEVMLRNIVRYEESSRNWTYSSYMATTGKDFLTLHWKNCPYVAKIKNKSYASGTLCELKQTWGVRLNPCKACASAALDPLWTWVKTVSFYDTVTVSAPVRFTMLPAYHIPGSASVLIVLRTQDGQKRKVLFSGDIGNDIEVIYKTPRPFPAVDVVVVEGTYGHKIRPRDYAQQKAAFIRDIAEALRQKKIVWIPAFALDRTQKILALLNKARQEGLLPASVPVYVPSPTAHEINQHYAQFERSEEFSLPHISHYLSDYERQLPRYESITGPAVLITTSGMLNQTYSYDLIPYLVPRSDVFLCFVGFQSAASPGGHIIRGAQTLLWKDGKGHTRDIPVRLSWKKYDFFSGHGDFQDIARYLSNNKEATIFLNHGEAETLAQMQQKLTELGFKKVIVAEKAKKYTLF